MFKKYQKFAPIGLIIGLIAAVTALVLRIASGQFSLSVQISIAISVLGLVIFVLLDPQTILQFFTGRQAKYGSNSLILTLAVLAILVIVNLFIYKNNVSWDLTEDKVNTLAPETLDVLENLNLPVYAQAFYSATINSENAETLLRNFKENSQGKFDYEFIDPYQDPVATTQAEIDRDGTTVLVVGEQSEKLTYLSEENLINAIIKLQNPEQSVIYMLTGHGEAGYTEANELSLTEAAKLMESKNYQIESLNLIASPAIPDDADALIIASPQVPLDQSEVDLISGYLDNGGSLILLSEPPFLTEMSEQDDPLKTYLTESWGISLGNNLVIDPSIDPAEFAIAEQYGDHPITAEVQSYITFFPTSQSIKATPTDSKTITDLILTTNSAWGETDIEGLLNNEAGFDEEDLEGPISLAVAGEDSSTNARIVVVGDSDFAKNAYVTAYGNLDLIIAMVDWTAENENLINLTPAQTTTRILVPPTRAAQVGIILGGLIGLPLFIALTGIIIAVQRRKTE